jgi:hypothetical protein
MLSGPSENEDSTELDDFSSYLSLEVWQSLPQALRDASYETRDMLPDIEDLQLGNVPVGFSDSLTAYRLCTDGDDSNNFLRRVLQVYLQEACAPPPVWSATRTRECEICERSVPLTYHHLIPRSTHAKVLKKQWHPMSMLNSVAWLCR